MRILTVAHFSLIPTFGSADINVTNDNKANNTSVVQGVPIEGEAAYYESGKLFAGTLARDHRFNSIALRAGTRFGLYESGNLMAATIQSAHVIHGVRYGAGRLLNFDEDGNVVSVRVMWDAE